VLSLKLLLHAFSALVLFECGRAVPRIVPSGLQRLGIIRVWACCPSNCSFGPSAPWYYSSAGVLVPRIAPSGYQCFSYYLSRNMVAINRFVCRILNMKVSPQLATLDGPVFVSSALCRENFYPYGMKKCTDGRIRCLAITGL
jgi:hypothetical protein